LEDEKDKESMKSNYEFIKENFTNYICVAIFNPGMAFGEVALIKNTKR